MLDEIVYQNASNFVILCQQRLGGHQLLKLKNEKKTIWVSLFRKYGKF